MKIKVIEQNADIPVRYARYMIANGLAERDTGDEPQTIETTVNEIVISKPTVKKKVVRKKKQVSK